MFFECFDAVFGLDASFAVEQGDLDEKYQKPPRQDRPQSQAQAWIASQGSRARPDRAGSRSTQKHPGGKERERERGEREREREAQGWISCPSNPPGPDGLEKHSEAPMGGKRGSGQNF